MMSVSGTRTSERLEEFFFLRKLSQPTRSLKVGSETHIQAHKLTLQLAAELVERLGGRLPAKVVVNALAMLLCCGLPLAHEEAMRSFSDPSFVRSQSGLLLVDAVFLTLLVAHAVNAKHRGQRTT
jgi:hypothetical protein